MARDENDQNQDKDFLDIDLDEPMEAIGDDIVADVDNEGEAALASTIAAPIRRAGDGILIYDNKRYAVGLNWLIAEDEGDTELATQRAKDFRADFYCMRQGVVTQHGFGYLAKGHRIGLAALASAAADTLVGEWHGVFVADNGWWYMAVHSDNIAPDGDILFASEEAAYNHFIAQNEAFRWPRTYAPESWSIPDSTGEVPLNKIIGESSAPQLKPVTLDAIFSGKRNKNLAFGALGVILALIVVSILGQQLLPSLVPIQAQVPVPDISVSDNLQVPPREPLVEEKPGESLTNMALTLPSSMIKACLTGFSSITVSLPGWTMGDLRCRESFVEASWKRNSGTLQGVMPYLSRFPPEVMRNFTNSSQLVANRKVEVEKITLPAQELYERNYAILAVSDRFANLGDVDIQEVTPAAVQDLLTGIDEMQQAGFSIMNQSKPTIRPLDRDELPYLQLEVKTDTPPNMIARYFDIPGLVMLGVSNNEGSWIYNAKLILRPDKRLIEANNKAKALQVR